MLHIPVASRERLCAIVSDCLECSLADDAPWHLLANHVHKLLLSSCPPGARAGPEMSVRIGLWEDGNLDGLLARLEGQACRRSQDCLRHTPTNSKATAAKRALRLARAGARSKAVQNFKGGIKTLTADHQRAYAAQLLPVAELPLPVPMSQQAAAHARVPAAAAEGDVGPAWNQSPLRGVSFPPLSAAGAFGARPEHTKELLMVRKRSVSNRYLRLLERYVETALAGNLPPKCRWILSSNLSFLDKPGSMIPRPIRAGEHLRRVGKSPPEKIWVSY